MSEVIPTIHINKNGTSHQFVRCCFGKFYNAYNYLCTKMVLQIFGTIFKIMGKVIFNVFPFRSNLLIYVVRKSATFLLVR
jgi:hypothetical protein